MNSNNREPGTPRSNGAAPVKCLVCGGPIGEACFCKLHRAEDTPAIFCCPSCAIQYLESTRAPADGRTDELRAYEKSTHFFVGPDKPWP